MNKFLSEETFGTGILFTFLKYLTFRMRFLWIFFTVILVYLVISSREIEKIHKIANIPVALSDVCRGGSRNRERGGRGGGGGTELLGRLNASLL